MFHRCLVTLVVFLSAVPHVLADDTTPTNAGADRIIIPLSHQPADVVAETLENMLGDKPDVRVHSSSVSNVVVLQAPPAEISKIVELIRELDRPLPMIAVEVVAVEGDNAEATTMLKSGPSQDVQRRLAELQGQQSVHVVDRLKFTTLSNQEAYIQVGQSVPSRTSQQTTRAGRVNSYSYHDTGVMLRCIPRASRDGSVAIEVSFEKSSLAPSQPSDDDQQPPMTMTKTQLQSTVRLGPGECVVMGGLREATDTDEHVEWRVILSAAVAN